MSIYWDIDVREDGELFKTLYLETENSIYSILRVKAN